MKQRKIPYKIAYELGINYLNNIDLKPNFAVMFDIDDTLLNTSNYKPIQPIINLIRECNKRGILVMIITARSSIYRKETIQDLEKIKVYSKHDNYFECPSSSNLYDYLYLRQSPQDDHALFKSGVKKHFAENGIFTIMSIGDNDIDIVGKYSGYAIKLPNTQDPRLFHKDSYGRMVNINLN